MSSKLRMEKRRKVLTFTPVYDVQTNALLGYLGDLTLKGALLVSEDPVEVDKVFTLAVEFREKSEIPASHRVAIPARVAWCKQEDHRTYYNTGMEFLKVTEKNKKIIESVMAKYTFSKDMPTKVLQV